MMSLHTITCHVPIDLPSLFIPVGRAATNLLEEHDIKTPGKIHIINKNLFPERVKNELQNESYQCFTWVWLG